MLIAILNQSTAVQNTDAETMTAAIASQIQTDVAPIWERAPATVTFYTDPTTVPAGAYVIAIVDTIPNQPTSLLGGHTENQAGQMSGVVAAQPELANGGQVLTGDWSVSSTLSHEVLEMFIDPNCNLWANDGQGSVYSFEVCDPVEAPTYPVNGVSVSNFVTPAWFRPAGPGGVPVRQTEPAEGRVQHPPGRLHDLRVRKRQGAAAVGGCIPWLAQDDEGRAGGPWPAAAASASGLVPRVTAGSTAAEREAQTMARATD